MPGFPFGAKFSPERYDNTGVVAVILGQALLFGAWGLILYGVLFWLACHAFVLVYEEPTLEQTFDAEY